MDIRHRSLALAALLVTVSIAVIAIVVGGGSIGRLLASPSPAAAAGATNSPTNAVSTRDSHTPAVKSRPLTPTVATARKPATRTGPLPSAEQRSGSALGFALRLFAVDALIACTGLIALAALIVKNRIDARERRRYRLYEVHLSMHDDAKPRDLHDMVEALAAAVREWPLNRARYGQPFFAIELHYGGTGEDAEFLICLRCEEAIVGTLQSVLANAYPDVRVGQTAGEAPQPLPGRLRVPGHVVRLRKEREFVYALSPREDTEASPTMEAIAQTQVMAGVGSSVRLQFTPAPLGMEGWARHKFRRHEDRLARSEQRLLSPDAGLRSVLNQEEMREATLAVHSAMFWFELQVAAPTAEHCRRIASALIARRAENRLQRRRMVMRLDLYRRRFPDAYPPLLPSFGFGRMPALVSAREVAHLLTLPTARMKAVPVRRLTIPRLPPPPEVARVRDRPVRTPDDPELTTTAQPTAAASTTAA